MMTHYYFIIWRLLVYIHFSVYNTLFYKPTNSFASLHHISGLNILRSAVSTILKATIGNFILSFTIYGDLLTHFITEPRTRSSRPLTCFSNFSFTYSTPLYSARHGSLTHFFRPFYKVTTCQCIYFTIFVIFV